MNILERIIAKKQDTIAARKRRRPLPALYNRVNNAPPPRGFLAAIAAAEPIAYIAEVKKASPSAGVIRPDLEPAQVIAQYARGGATALSILTEEHFFQGSLANLSLARANCELPLLCKDFFVDSYQVIEARAAGADAILLIAAALDDHQLKQLYRSARELDMDCLVEVHNAAEFQSAVDLGARLIGVNNRDLATFGIDLATTERLAALLPADAFLVAESGICSGADVRRMMVAGASAVLVGSHLMRQPHPGKALQEMRREVANAAH